MFMKNAKGGVFLGLWSKTLRNVKAMIDGRFKWI